MAFHDGLSLTQRILLGVFCFPLLPFYMCYVCCCARDDDDDNNSQESKHKRTEEGRGDKVDARSAEVRVDVQPTTCNLPNRSSSRKERMEEGAKSETGRSVEVVTVEIHPKRGTSSPSRKFSFGKGKEKKTHEVVYEKKGKEKRKNEVVYENEGFAADEDSALNAYPWDQSNLKTMLIDLNKFKELDAYASKVRASSGVGVLVQDLLKRTNSDIEKLRAIWIWVTHHIEYDVEGLHHPERRSTSPDEVLKRGKGVCAGYAVLFQVMCSHAGIECKEVSGYSKGYSYEPGTKFTGDSDHAWNAVKLRGRWHLLDSTWGAGSVNENCSKFTFKYNEYYFLTHPALFVGDHFPLDRQWQLLKPQVSLRQFENALRRRSHFYLSGLISSEPESALVHSDGKTTITIKSSSPTLFMHDLNGKDNCGILTLQADGMKLDVYPPQIGKHSLKIYSKEPNSAEDSYQLACEYQLQCAAVDREMRLPDDLRNPVGPSWLSETKGLLDPSQRGPLISTTDGRCSVGFREESRLDLMAMLSTGVFPMSDDQQRRHTIMSRKGSRVDFGVQIPRAGLYQLYIYGKDKSVQGNYSLICSYLISCTNPRVSWPVYPLMYSTWKEGYELLEPLSGVLPANRVVQFKMKIPDVSQVSVEGRDSNSLSLGPDGYWSGSSSTMGCRDLGVLVKVKSTDQTLQYVLNYQVENN